MDMQADRLFEATTLGTLLRRRPLAMALCESSGIDPWKNPNQGLGDALHARGIDVQDFLRALRGLPVAAPGSDWASLPVYHLLDRLVDEHRAFLHDTIPAIGRVLSEDVFSDADSLEYLDRISREWPAFTASLAAHFREEEDVLFRRVLRYHSCLAQGGDPDLEGGSVRVFGTVRMLTHGHRDLELTRLFLEKVLPTMPGERPAPSALEARLRPLLDALHRDLIRHAQLESQVLFPRAIAMEKALYDQLIQGRDARPAATPATTRDFRDQANDAPAPRT